MDVWQLGVLMFELFAQREYWPRAMVARDVMTALLTPGQLPHERDPAVLDSVGKTLAAQAFAPKLRAMRAMLPRLLTRVAANRPNALEVWQLLSHSRLESTVADSCVLMDIVSLGS